MNLCHINEIICDENILRFNSFELIMLQIELINYLCNMNWDLDLLIVGTINNIFINVLRPFFFQTHYYYITKILFITIRIPNITPITRC